MLAFNLSISRTSPAERRVKLITRDEARRRAANMLPDLLRKVDAKNRVPSSSTLVQTLFHSRQRGRVTMIATEIPAAIRPYSMALAPDAPFMKRKATLSIGLLLAHL